MIIATTWNEYTKNGKQYRKRLIGKEVEVQQKVVQTEFSHTKLVQKACAGLYDLEDMRICGTGNTYLIHGWKSILKAVRSYH